MEYLKDGTPIDSSVTRRLQIQRGSTEMRNYYFTFGFGQGHDHMYVKIVAPSSEEAREIMIEQYGTTWGFQYDEEQFLPQIVKYRLKELV